MKILLLLLLASVSYGQKYESYKIMYNTVDSIWECDDTTSLEIKEVWGVMLLKVNKKEIILDDYRGSRDSKLGFVSVFYKSKDAKDQFFMIELLYHKGRLSHIFIIRSNTVETYIIEPLKLYT